MASVRTIIPVFLFSAASAFAIDHDEVRALKQQARSRMRVATHAQSTAPKTVTVDCTKGEKIQEAVDKNAAPLDIVVTGVCVENVLILGKSFTLSGTSPATDGIQGATGTALIVRGVHSGAILNLSLSNSPGNGLTVHASDVTVENCTVNSNGGTGIVALGGTQLFGTDLTISFNGVRGMTSNGGRFVACLGCRVENNVRFAGVASNAGVLTFLDSEVIGSRGISANSGGYIDIDCITQGSGNPCSMQATLVAAFANGNSQAWLYGAGNFSGNVLGDTGGGVVLYGARQTSLGGNFFDDFATLLVVEDDLGNQSTLRGTTGLSGFSRALLRGTSTLNGSIECDSAGDAWVDPTVIKIAGSSVTGCDHASYP